MKSGLIREEVEEEIPWWEWGENVVFLAEHVVRENGAAQTVLDVFQRPWEFSTEYATALQAGVDYLCSG